MDAGAPTLHVIPADGLNAIALSPICKQNFMPSVLSYAIVVGSTVQVELPLRTSVIFVCSRARIATRASLENAIR
jgi:hypothetical protein